MTNNYEEDLVVKILYSRDCEIINRKNLKLIKNNWETFMYVIILLSRLISKTIFSAILWYRIILSVKFEEEIATFVVRLGCEII